MILQHRDVVNCTGTVVMMIFPTVNAAIIADMKKRQRHKQANTARETDCGVLNPKLHASQNISKTSP